LNVQTIDIEYDKKLSLNEQVTVSDSK